MISFNPDTRDVYAANRYKQGFRAVDTDDVERIAKCMSRFNWSPIIWKDGVRCQENFISCNWLVFDFDDPDMSLEEAKRSFCDSVHIIGTTRNHQREKNSVVCDRFRVATPFALPITDLRTFRYTMHKYMHVYPVDDSCKDGGRLFFPCKEIVSIEPEGFTADPYFDVPERFERYDPDRLAKCKASGVMPSYVRWFLKNKIDIGARNNKAYGIARDLMKLGYPKDRVFDMIMQSPTYKGIEEEEIKKLRYTVDCLAKQF
jgi:hypothetical protein